MPIKFPKDFLFGTATSSYQIEGNNKNCDWWKAEQEGKLPYKSGKACNFWKKWKDDIKLMSKLGYDAFRFSIEWSRVIPKKGKVNEGALKKYSKIVDFCLANEIKPLVTLWHFTLPQWFAKLGGFEKRENLCYWKDYIKAVVNEIGNKVELWGPINEPTGHSCSFINGSSPPFKSNVNLAKKVLANYFIAHSQAYKLIKERNPEALVGNVLDTSVVDPVSEATKEDKKAASTADRYLNGYQIETFKNFQLPKELGGYKIGKCLDFLGINYYSRCRIKYDPLKPLGFSVAPPPSQAEITEMGWEVYPEGFLKILKRYSKISKPIIVTENGISTYDDEQRCRFILRHLLKLKKAMNKGCDIRGYFYWSFMDNFEWREGFRQRFGLIEVNYENFERKPRESARIYGKIARNKRIDNKLLNKFKISNLSLTL